MSIQKTVQNILKRIETSNNGGNISAFKRDIGDFRKLEKISNKINTGAPKAESAFDSLLGGMALAIPGIVYGSLDQGDDGEGKEVVKAVASAANVIHSRWGGRLDGFNGDLARTRKGRKALGVFERIKNENEKGIAGLEGELAKLREQNTQNETARNEARKKDITTAVIDMGLTIKETNDKISALEDEIKRLRGEPVPDP